MRVRIRLPRRGPKKLVSRQRSKRSAQLTLLITVTAVFGSLWVLLGNGGLMSVMRMRARAAQMEYEISTQERANDELRAVIEPLRDADPQAIERIARERLQMARPGDTIYLLPPAPEPRVESPARSESLSPMAPALPSGR